MSARARTFVAVAAAGDLGDDRLQWIEVMPVAEKARNGRFYFTVTRDDLDTYATYIRDNGDRIVVDYDHEGADGGSTVAAGWFTGQAEVRDTEQGPRLYAQVEWTPQGLEDVQTKRFRFISPEFSFKQRDTKTGLMTKAKEIIAATLTNRPFFSELAAVAAAGDVVWNPDDGYSMLQSELAEALNPGPGESYRYWVCDVSVAGDRALIQESGPDGRTWVVPFSRVPDADEDGSYDIQVAPASEWIEAEQEWVQATQAARAAQARFNGGEAAPTEGEQMHESLKAVAAELGLADDATDEQVIEAVKATKATRGATVPEDAVVLDKDTVAQLTASAAKGEQAHAELHALKVRTLLDDAIRDRKILPVQRDGYAAMAAADFDGVQALLDATPAGSVATATRGSNGGDNGDGEPASQEIEAVQARFSGELGEDAPQEQAAVHVKAMEILGKPDYSTEEYVAAVARAERELGLTYRERPRDERSAR